MDWTEAALRTATLPTRPWKALCAVPADLDAVTSIGPEADPVEADTTRHAVDHVFDAARRLYRTGLYPALQICIRRRGTVVLNRALGVEYDRVVKMAADPRFLAGIAPAANGVSTAEELSAFYQCLLDEGEFRGRTVFEPRTVHRATVEQSFWELDLTLGLPLRYGLGFMLGQWPVSLFGWDTTHAFGHLGFTNIFSWADPERDLAAAVVTSGKPFLNAEVVRLLELIFAIGRSFPKVSHP